MSSQGINIRRRGTGEDEDAGSYGSYGSYGSRGITGISFGTPKLGVSPQHGASPSKEPAPHTKEESGIPPGMAPTSSEEAPFLQSVSLDSDNKDKPPQEVRPLVDARSVKERSLLRGYLVGQISNACSFGVWWVLFSPFVISLFNSTGVGASRVCYSGALFFLSPLSGALAERGNIKAFLCITTGIRGALYAIVLPVLWVTLQFYWTVDALFYALFLITMILDGVFVSLGNVVSTDCGGLDLLTSQHGISIDDHDRNYFNTYHQGFFDGSMIVLTPLIALAAKLISDRFDEKYQSAFLLASLAVSLGLFALISVVSYLANIPNRFLNTLPSDKQPAGQSVGAKMKDALDSVYGGLKIFLVNPRIRWRLVFLAFETSLEDAMVVLMIAEFGVRILGNNHFTNGNLWAACIVSFGKIGAVVGAVLMHKLWKPSSTASYGVLFLCCLVSGVSTLLIPLAAHLHEDLGQELLGTLLVFAASLIFFFFATIPKIGFATLLQSISADEEASGRIFGFAATFVTAVDALLIMGLSQVFEHAALDIALWVTALGFCAVGLVEGLLGPYLMELGGIRVFCMGKMDV
eukprot:CAMPEP_0177638064 /NCGR_PEP_ID=MMETSP0447-20121125/5294_1 /TAXON_ID=0 /ORGANISM="Stygamoeba regulata, Strain BSH-02190019" /LENGTH=576 /DNA_ID=CAMNT_0019140011 /DNA_START=42 /DNA_END=1768 /DNA_ORIENTATION=+